MAHETSRANTSKIRKSCERLYGSRQNFLETCRVRSTHHCEPNIKGVLLHMTLLWCAQRTLPNPGLFFPCLFLALTSCMPTTNAPNSEPIYYQGSITDVYASVVQAMSLSPGLDNSTGWIITQSDAAGHFIRAETLVTPVILGIPMIIQKNNESVSVVVSGQDSRTQVLIQFTQAAKPLADFIKEQLDTTFQRAID